MRINRTLVIFLSAFLPLCTMSMAHAGAWTMEKGRSYNRFAFNYYHADQEFKGGGGHSAMADNGEFLDTNVSYYLEYGLTSDATLITSAYYKRIEKEDDTIEVTTWGVGDLDLGLKYRLLPNLPGALSVQGMVKIPEFYDEEEHLPLGNGQYDFELRALYGISLSALLPGYCNVEAAYRWRAESPADEFRYLAEFGMNLTDRLYGRAKLDGILGVGNADETIDDFGNPTTSEEFDLLKLDLALGYQASKAWGVELGYAPALAGKDTARGETWTVALTLQTF